MQAKPHVPLLHVALAFATVVVQATGEPQAPLALHVSTLLPEHVTWFGAHTPVHAPDTQVLFTHATAVP